MNAIKKYADQKDLQALKFIFVDALDVDPTFENYKDGYNYCKACGMLEPHQELTPFINDPSKWDKTYWRQLKGDILENLSEKRIDHMCKVAKVVHKDRIERILAERAERAAAAEKEKKSPPSVSTQKPNVENATSKQAPFMSSKEQEKWLEERRKQIAEDNQKQEQQAKQPEDHKSGRENTSYKPLNTERSHSNSKKAMGIALAAAAVVAAVVIVAIIVK